MPATSENVTIMGANVVFRNFQGREAKFNSQGDRNFCILLEKELADLLLEGGWNIKYLKPREDDAGQVEDPKPYVQVAVNYAKGRPPRVVLVTSSSRTELGADEVEMLDMADVSNWDVVLNPYHWDVPGTGKGVKAYLKTLYATLNEDELELKYALMHDAQLPAEVVE